MDMCAIWCDGNVWDMCGVRYANNLVKNPATKRLSGKKVKIRKRQVKIKKTGQNQKKQVKIRKQFKIKKTSGNQEKNVKIKKTGQNQKTTENR